MDLQLGPTLRQLLQTLSAVWHRLWAWVVRRWHRLLPPTEPLAAELGTGLSPAADSFVLELPHAVLLANRVDQTTVRRVFAAHHIRRAYFVHGTFVGDDPFGLLDAFSRVAPEGTRRVRRTYRMFFERRKQMFYGDQGNFSPAYAEAFSSFIGPPLSARLFSWSSGNHHLARVQAVFELAQTLYQSVLEDPTATLLLVGHSHGGNLFALLSKFCRDPDLWQRAWHLSGVRGDPATLEQAFRRLASHPLRWVSMGTPVRYLWDLAPPHDALHLINHRSVADPLSPSQMLRTAAGDYIQLMGHPKIDANGWRTREVNDQLGRLLEPQLPDMSMPEIFRCFRRLHSHGTTLLLDYDDASPRSNFVASGLGHITYTRLAWLPGHCDLIARWLDDRLIDEPLTAH